VKDFVFQIDSCVASKRTLVCEPTVTDNATEDREISMSVVGADDDDGLGKMTRILDDAGNEYFPKDIRLGSIRKTFGPDLGVCCPETMARGAACSFGGCIIKNTLIPGVPMKIRIVFSDINPDAKTVAVLRIYFSWKDAEGGKLKADLRAIPITQ